VTIKISNTNAADSLKLLGRAVFLSNKNQFDKLARLLLPLVAEKEDIKRDCKQINKCEMEPVKKKTKQAGRPAKIVKKEIRAAVRFSKTEHFVIRHKAAKAGMKVSAYVRQIAILSAF